MKKPSTKRLFVHATDTLIELGLIYLGILIVSAVLFAFIEGHTFLESFYWAGTTATSTGYGDISPKTPAGEMLALLLMHVSIFVIAPLIVVRLISAVNHDVHVFTNEEQEEMKAQLSELLERVRNIEDHPHG